MPSQPAEPLPRPVPRLERQIDGLSFSEWPGRRGPLVCLVDPLGGLPGLAEAIAADRAPDWRVFELPLPGAVPYQAQAAEVTRLLDTFGFEHSVLLGSGLAASLGVVVGAWYPARLDGLVVVNFHPDLTRARRLRLATRAADEPAFRAWLDAPPRWARLESQLTCPVLRLRARTVRRVVEATRSFLDSRVQSDPCC